MTDEIVDDRLDEGAERHADDDADGEIDHVTLEREFLEFIEH